MGPDGGFLSAGRTTKGTWVVIQAIDLSEDDIVIPPWRDDVPLVLRWEENDTWEDICRRYSILFYDTFQDFIQCDSDEELFEYPFSVRVYEIGNRYLLSKNEILESECLRDCVTIPRHYFNLVEFYREMCLPFVNVDTLVKISEVSSP